MDIVLPRELAYSPSLPSLPECTNIDIVASPVNGNTFGAGQLIQFDLVSKGYLDPSSLYIRYNYTIAGGVGNATIRGTPVYSFFQSLKPLSGLPLWNPSMIIIKFAICGLSFNLTSL